MRLISCYIEAYGKIKRQEFKFDKNLTALCEKNGYGKTTLTSFIKAMFYGLDQYRANSKTFCERQHFYPFEGGLFGGNITFEANGKTYKIERFFGEKSEKDDTLKVYKDGNLTQESGTDIGKTIFGIDREAFERTAFIDGSDIEISSTSSINAKMNNLLEGVSDDSNIDSAIDSLEKLSKRYKKQKSGIDLISEKKAQIDDLTARITNLEIVKAALGSKYSKRKQLEEEIKDLKDSLEKARSLNAVLKDWERHDDLSNDKNTATANLKGLEEKYPNGIPKREDLDEVNARLADNEKLKAQLSQKSFTDGDQTKLTNLQDLFKEGVPEESKLEEIEQTLNEITKIDANITSAKNVSLTQKERDLTQKFGTRCPTESDFEKLGRTAEDYKKAHDELSLIPSVIAETVKGIAPTNTAKPKTFIALAAVAALILLAGIAMLFVQQIVGIALSVVGVIALLAVAFMFLLKRTGGGTIAETVIQKENPERKLKERKVEELSDTIKAFVIPYGYATENGVLAAFDLIKQDVLQYQDLLKTQEETNKRIESAEAEKTNLTQEVESFFAPYKLEETTYNKKLSSLREKISTFQDLEQRKANSDSQDSKLNQDIEDNNVYIKAFCEKYSLENVTGSSLNSIRDDIAEVKRLEKQIEELTQKLQSLITEKNLVERPVDLAIDINALSYELDKLTEDHASLLLEIQNDESEVESLDELNSQKDEAKELLKEYENKHKILTATINFIKEADQNLKDKYVKPIKDKFVEYSALLEKTLGEKVYMNTNFEISFERNGIQRSDKHLSAGQRSICALCFRLALIWNMYAEEKPFLIMDDPFTSLDAEHLTKVKDILQKMSNDMQIIYFACHESRAM